MDGWLPKGGWKLGRDSYSKLVVYFKDGNVRTLWSIDWKHRYSKTRNKDIGLKRLQKKISEYSIKAGVAIIYNKATNQPIAKYYEGKEVEIRDTSDEFNN